MLPFDQVDRVAGLACLQLQERQREDLARDLATILESMQQLQQLDLQAETSTFQTNVHPDVFRRDEVIPSLPVAEALRNAPRHQDQLVTVPLIIHG
jgi:aspartyl-tRNA(Asn)/glutamyl-tRNA(Gln) amidotransferase subunit C